MHSLEKRFSISGKTILLTGGAGKYGGSLLAALSAAGARVIAASRNRDALLQAASQCDGEIHVETLDQADEASVLALRDTIRDRFGNLDGLVNNAVARPAELIADRKSLSALRLIGNRFRPSGALARSLKLEAAIFMAGRCPKGL